jgi:hypothetical protein
MYIVDLLAIHFIVRLAGEVALDPSGESGAFRHDREDYTARAETGSGLFH